jgi:magnesium chelatase subunit D
MTYPFAALVGQESLKTALLLNAVDPGIGGVLISGEKGTAKSTAARALAEIMPAQQVVAGCPFRCDPSTPDPKCTHCGELAERPSVDARVPFIDLPLGATEDRILGSLDFERALREGRRVFQPGLLAACHRGVLYVDEVNLLPDHLVDILLDAAASGVNVVQREGVEVVHPSRFLLIGTMNPEEGELRPQLLDRFGLMVEVAGPRDPAIRAEVVRRRVAFDADSVAFARRWETEQSALHAVIATARHQLAHITLDDELLLLISRLCCEFGADGLRADIAFHKASRASGALAGRDAVSEEDVRCAAAFVLPHRRRRRPFEKPGLDHQRLDDLMAEGRPSRGDASNPSPASDPAPGETGTGSERSTEKDNGDKQDAGTQIFEAAAAGPARPIEVVASTRVPQIGRGKRSTAGEGRGSYARAVPDETPDHLAIDATLRSAALNGLGENGKPIVLPSNLHRKERTGRTGTLILFVVDASGSMAARRRMEAVKGAVLSLLRDAYECRDRVGVIAFRGPEAELLLPPTDSVELAEQAMRSLPTGGRTPLAHALVLASETIRRACGAGPSLVPMPVLLTDGKANVCVPDRPGDPWEQALRAAGELAEVGLAALVLDTEDGFVRLGRAREIADALGAEHLSLDDLTAESLVLNVRQRRGVSPAGRPR